MFELVRTFLRGGRPRGASRRSRRPALEPLHDRIAPAVTLVAGQVIIQGTPGNDVAAVGATSAQVFVTLNGQLSVFNRAAVNRIAFVGDLGDDRCVNTTNLQLVAVGGAGNDVLVGGGGNDLIDGGDGNDSLTGGGGNDVLVGGLGNDTLNGGDGNDGLAGGGGDDVLLGGNGNDVAFGGAGTDVILGASGDDWLRGDDGRDGIDGGLGNDFLTGDLGDDVLRGGDGDDGLLGGDGNDILEGGRGRDAFRGGAGVDYSDRRADDLFHLEDELHELKATLTGSPGLSGEAEFHTIPQPGDFDFEVKTFGQTPGQVMTVLLDNVAVGTFVVRADGRGQLEFNNPSLPVRVGSVVRVRSAAGVDLLVGTFTADT